MKRSNRLVILVGVLLAVLAFVGIVFLLNGGGGSGNGPEASQAPGATVLIATRDIEQGEPVTPDMVKTDRIDPAAVLPGTPLTDPSQMIGRPALRDIPEGGQVTAEDVGGAVGPVPLSMLLQPGEKAIAFQIDRVTGLDFLIQPGDHVDVVMRQDLAIVQPVTQTGPANEWKYEVTTTLESTPTVKTVLQNKRVLYVSATRVEPITGPEPTPTPTDGQQQQQQPQLTSIIIIIAGTDQDAELIKLAQSDVTVTGNLTVVLRHADDTAPEDTSGVTLSLLISRYGVPVPDIVLLERSAP